jgi:hypothetical protein
MRPTISSTSATIGGQGNDGRAIIARTIPCSAVQMSVAVRKCGGGGAAAGSCGHAA